MRPMRFVHISDTHIAADPAYSHYGHAPLANLEALVDAINALRFEIDFVLHTGDLVEDRSQAAYRLAQSTLARLRAPIWFVAGNHDNVGHLRSVFLREEAGNGRFDYDFMAGGVHVAVFDTQGPKDPQGSLLDGQLEAARQLCVPEGPPLVLCLHHPPLPLDSLWLDRGWTTTRKSYPDMILDRGEEFLRAISPARDRIRGVFFGHIHRACQVLHRGIMFSSAPSSFGQLLTWPDQVLPEPSPAEPAGFNLVTVTEDRTIVRQHAIPRPG
jgi:3',5'-cyclic-AMP phosphodiesterase